MYVSTEITLEYEEKLRQFYSPSVTENFLRALRELPNVHKVETYFLWQMVTATDPDDNKFVDAAFAANVHYLVSDDKHYRPLANSDFPKINRVKLAEFKKILDSISNHF